MPEIDPNLYQILTLVLLLVIGLALIGVVSALSGIKKALGEPEARAATQAPAADEREQPAAAAVAPATATPTPAEAAVPTGGFAPAEENVPQAAAPASAASPAQASPVTAAEPQEQPFERDGRWWFRRGNELLVYDETSGQWMPAPEPSGTSAAAVGGAAAAASGSETESGFWKCSSCGAVNGSTATTCRMCFTARP